MTGAGGGLAGHGAGVRTDGLTPDFLLVLISQLGSQPYVDVLSAPALVVLGVKNIIINQTGPLPL